MCTFNNSHSHLYPILCKKCVNMSKGLGLCEYNYHVCQFIPSLRPYRQSTEPPSSFNNGPPCVPHSTILFKNCQRRAPTHTTLFLPFNRGRKRVRSKKNLSGIYLDLHLTFRGIFYSGIFRVVLEYCGTFRMFQ